MRARSTLVVLRSSRWAATTTEPPSGPEREHDRTEPPDDGAEVRRGESRSGRFEPLPFSRSGPESCENSPELFPAELLSRGKHFCGGRSSYLLSSSTPRVCELDLLRGGRAGPRTALAADRRRARCGGHAARALRSGRRQRRPPADASRRHARRPPRRPSSPPARRAERRVDGAAGRRPRRHAPPAPPRSVPAQFSPQMGAGENRQTRCTECLGRHAGTHVVGGAARLRATALQPSAVGFLHRGKSRSHAAQRASPARAHRSPRATPARSKAPSSTCATRRRSAAGRRRGAASWLSASATDQHVPAQRTLHHHDALRQLLKLVGVPSSADAGWLRRRAVVASRMYCAIGTPSSPTAFFEERPRACREPNGRRVHARALPVAGSGTAARLSALCARRRRRPLSTASSTALVLPTAFERLLIRQALVGLGEQLGQGDPEGLGEARQREEGRIDLAALDAPT